MLVSMDSYLRHLSLMLIALLSIMGEFLCYGDPNVPSCSVSDLKALVEFKNGLDDPENRLSSWNGTDCCQWEGIGCNNVTGAVVSIDLHNPLARYGFWNLSGDISPSLTRLKSLQYLDLSFNAFNGIPFPESLGSFKSLRYLNLAEAGFSGAIPTSLGNLSSLEYLDLSNDFGSLSVGDLEWVSGLGYLKSLFLNGVDLSLVKSGSLDVLNELPHLVEFHLPGCGLSGDPYLGFVNFSSLAVMDLNFNNFDAEFPHWLVNVSGLIYVDLSHSNLRGKIPLGIGELPYLKYLYLSGNNNLSASCSELLQQSWSNIEVLDLAFNELHGELPDSIGNLTSLTEFNLQYNNVEGGIPSSIGRLCNLEYFDISNNNFTGTLPRFLEGADDCLLNSPLPRMSQLSLGYNMITGELPEWLGELRDLVDLSLEYNLIQGFIPASLGNLKNLTTIGLEGNKLTGTLPTNIGKLSKLSRLDVSLNQLTGVVTDVHFSELRNLTVLKLSSNSLYVNISSDWVSPFQLQNLAMSSCHLGPMFPSWLQTQKQINYLDLSNASMSGPMPHWFWDISSNLSLLNVSHNQLTGQLPKQFDVASFADVDFSFNLFEGLLPVPSVEVELFDLSNNNFSGPIPQTMSESMPNLIFLSLSSNQLTGEIPANIGNMKLLQVIDLSSNRLSGSIPSGIGNCSFLKVLDLANNNLSAEISGALGQLVHLKSLHLNDNELSGYIPSSFQNLSSLETLDLGNNKLTGNIPPWIGAGFQKLRILRLRSNDFSGSLPASASNLSSLQVLDLAQNKFTGGIPTSFGDFKAMSQVQNRNQYLFYGFYRGVYYEENLVINTKSQSQKYSKTLSLMISLDLSRNNLTGMFPEELTNLLGLLVLNLSGNHLSGNLPERFSRLNQLLSLDLSNNIFSGALPRGMSSLTFLGHLNLSNNNFSGMIPLMGQMVTFDASSFAGNPGLCGKPLLVRCQVEDPNKGGAVEATDDDDFTDNWFYLGIGVGFAAGILVPFLLLSLIKSWGDSYFIFLNNIVNFLLARNNVAKHRGR